MVTAVQELLAASILAKCDADGAHKSGRLYPAYTTAELKEMLKKHSKGDPTYEKMAGEIARRESGESKPFSTPQAKWGKSDASYSGYVVERIGKYKIIEGSGKDAGYWFAEGRGEVKRFKTKREASDHAVSSSDD